MNRSLALWTPRNIGAHPLTGTPNFAPGCTFHA